MTVQISESTRVGLLRGLVADAIATGTRQWSVAEIQSAPLAELEEAGLVVVDGDAVRLKPKAVRLVLR